MTPTFTAFAVLLLLTLPLPSSSAAKLTTAEDLGIPTSSSSLVKQMASCSCSPSRRGFNPTDAQNLQVVLQQVRDIFAVTEPKLGTRIATIAAYLYGVSIFKQCIRHHGYEACVNADAALRAPGYSTFCTYDSISQRNLLFTRGNYTVTPPCDTAPRFRSTREQRGGNFTVFPPTPPPLPRAPLPVLPADSPTPRPSIVKGFPLATGDDAHTRPTQTPATRRHPDVLPLPSMPPRRGTARSPRLTPEVVPTAVPTPKQSAPGPPPPIVEPEGDGGNRTDLRGEGCVAVEHLRGYVLQHRRDLVREVLCADGFCATRNHGIFVDGVYTSMGRLCGDGGWVCTREVRKVNNLKIAVNRRAYYEKRVVITPYDVRFPVPLIWVVQMLEDVWEIVAVAGAFGLMMGLLVVVHAKVWMQSRLGVSGRREGSKEERKGRRDAAMMSKKGWALLDSQIRL